MQLLGFISGETLIQALIWIVVAGLVFWILNWAIAKIGLPEPFAKIAMVLLVLIVVIVAINALLLIAGHPFIRF